MEMELRDSERQQFMKARAKVESDRAAAALRAAQARKDKLARCSTYITALFRVKALSYTNQA